VTESAVTGVCGKSVGGLFRAGVSVRPMNTPAQTQLLRLLPLTLILSTAAPVAPAATAQPASPDELTIPGTTGRRERLAEAQ
jgi:hypothetical protein